MKLQRIGTGNWAYCLEKLSDSTKLATAREGMLDRIACGVKDLEHFNSGAWFAENFNVVGGRILAARKEYNPLIQYASQATAAHRNGKEFYLTDEIILEDKPASKLLAEIAEQDKDKPLGKRKVADLGKIATHSVPTDCFADDETIVFLAQGKNLARKYGNFLRASEIGIQEVNVYLPGISEKDYSRGFWLGGLVGDFRSSFDCSYRDLDGDYGSVFGVSLTGEARAQKISAAPKVRISQPSLKEVLSYSRNYVAKAAWNEFESGLKNLSSQKKK